MYLKCKTRHCFVRREKKWGEGGGGRGGEKPTARRRSDLAERSGKTMSKHVLININGIQ